MCNARRARTRAREWHSCGCAALISCLQVLYNNSESSFYATRVCNSRLFSTLFRLPNTPRRRLDETHADRELLLSSGAMYVLGGSAGGTANDGAVPPL